MRYEPVIRLTREQLIANLKSDDPNIVAEALYSGVRFEEDFEWIQELCLEKIQSPDLAVRWAAATCIGDLAFLHRPLDLRRVIPALEAAISDPAIADPASFSLSIVRQFSANS